MSLTALTPFAPAELIEHITSTMHEALSLRGDPSETLVIDHEGLSLGGAVDRYVFSFDQGDLTLDFSQIDEERVSVDRIAVESRPDVLNDAQFASNLSACLELFSDSDHMGWSPVASAEEIMTLDRVMDLLHVMARTHQQMQDTAQFIHAASLSSATGHAMRA